VELLERATEYEQLVALAGRVDQLLRRIGDLVAHRERGASTAGGCDLEHDWRPSDREPDAEPATEEVAR